MQSAHDLDVERLKRVPGGLNEVDAGMDAVVDDVHAVNLVLGVEVGVKSLLNVLHDRSPRVVVIDEVTKAGRVHHGQAQADAVLLNVGADALYAHGLGSKVQRRLLALLGRVKGRVEESVDKGRFAKARFTCHPMSARSYNHYRTDDGPRTYQRP